MGLLIFWRKNRGGFPRDDWKEARIRASALLEGLGIHGQKETQGFIIDQAHHNIESIPCQGDFGLDKNIFNIIKMTKDPYSLLLSIPNSAMGHVGARQP